MNLDLAGDGPTPNDPCDPDNGPNKLQNKAVLTQALDVGGALHAQGMIDSTMFGRYTIEGYASPACDLLNPAAHKYLGSNEISNSAACETTFDLGLFLPGPGDNFMTAIVRDTQNSTSEISNCVPIPIIVLPGVDLSLQKSAAPDPATEGRPLTWTLTVTNNGGGDASAVTITDPLPAGVTFSTASPGCANSSGTVTCTLGSVAANGGLETRMITAIPTGPGVVVNNATVSSAETDENPGDNAAQASTPVVSFVHDLLVGGAPPAITCQPPGVTQVCGIAGVPSFLDSDIEYFRGTLNVTSTCKKPGTTKVSCNLKGTLVVDEFDLTGVPAHSIGAYFSADAVLDSADTRIATGTTVQLAKFAPRGKSVKIKHKQPKGQTYTGKFLLLALDTLNQITEPNEGDNVLVIGPLP